MPTYAVSGYQLYDVSVDPAVIDGPTVVESRTLTDVDGDNEADIGEDLTGEGNLYIGYVTIDGVDFMVVTGSEEISAFWMTDEDVAAVVVPAGTDPNSINWPQTGEGITLIEDPFTFCFAAGTMITTDAGDVAVQDLTREHNVMTPDGRAVPVKWVGRQTIRPWLKSRSSFSMVRIAAGALGPNLPASDLTVTGDHGMILDGMVVNASAMVNGDSIRFVDASELPKTMVVYHVETEEHEVILANGAPSETFIDTAGRKAYDNYQDYLELFGAERIVREMQLPRISSARLLPVELRERLGLEHRSTKAA